MHFLDDFSRFVWICALKLKSDVVDAFSHFITMVEKKKQFGKMVRTLQTDNGREYVKIHKVSNEPGIQSWYSCPYTSAQNRRVGRKHRHITEMGLTLLAQAAMPLKFL